MGKGKVHYIEVISDEEDEGDEEKSNNRDEGQNSGEAPHLEIPKHAPLQEGVKKVTIATLLGVPMYYTFQIRGIMKVQRVTTLIDGGATHNFIDATLVTRRQIPTKEFEGFEVLVADGYNMTCT